MPRKAPAMPKITPFLWFDGLAEEAATFYVSIFPNSKITAVLRCGEAGPGPVGSVLTIGFELDGQTFTGLNGGPAAVVNESVSFVIDCQDQGEVDHYWETLVQGGEPIMCGWLKDRYGLRWQVTPRALIELLADPDEAKAARVMRAMMQMVKIDIAALEAAAAGARA
jgi:predicted 3-demethylubiquinone-9 3-methyltransferase (glyoxalase superfamily)